jgi:hypothetical protein
LSTRTTETPSMAAPIAARTAAILATGDENLAIEAVNS